MPSQSTEIQDFYIPQLYFYSFIHFRGGCQLFSICVRICSWLTTTSYISIVSLISCYVLPKSLRKHKCARLLLNMHLYNFFCLSLELLMPIYFLLCCIFQLNTIFTSLRNPSSTNTASLQIIIAWVFLLSVICALFRISFFKVKYILASFFGGEPPTYIKISVEFNAIEAEHW